MPTDVTWAERGLLGSKKARALLGPLLFQTKPLSKCTDYFSIAVIKAIYTRKGLLWGLGLQSATIIAARFYLFYKQCSHTQWCRHITEYLGGRDRRFTTSLRAVWFR